MNLHRRSPTTWRRPSAGSIPRHALIAAAILRQIIVGMLILSVARPATAQELEPLAYASNPRGANFLLLAYTNQWGDVFFDASAPLSDVSARFVGASLIYGRAGALFGRSSNFAVAVPYVHADASGRVSGEFGQVTRNGFADPRIRFGINLLGAPAMDREAFAAAPPRTTLGATLVVAPPVGQYLPDKLVNLGANRWSYKAELGLSHPVGRWRFETAAGVWWFSENDEFLGSSHRTQDPIEAYQLHAVYTIRRQLWLAASATWYRGSTTTVDGVEDLNFQSNTRFGLSASYPLARGHSLKFAYEKGVTTRVGGNFKRILLGWQYTWF